MANPRDMSSSTGTPRDRDSWVNAYEEVDFDVPHFRAGGRTGRDEEREAMLPPSPGLPSGRLGSAALGDDGAPSASNPPSQQRTFQQGGPPTPPIPPRIPAQARTYTRTSPSHSALDLTPVLVPSAPPSATRPPSTSPPSAFPASTSFAASTSSPSSAFGIGSASASSSSNSSNTLGNTGAPQIPLNVNLGIGSDQFMTPSTLQSTSGSPASTPAGAGSGSATVSSRSPRSSSFKSFASSPLATSALPAQSGPPFLVLTSNAPHNFASSMNANASTSASSSTPNPVSHQTAKTHPSILPAGGQPQARPSGASAATAPSLPASGSAPSPAGVTSSSNSTSTSGPAHFGTYPSSSFARPGSRGSNKYIQYIASEESRVLASGSGSSSLGFSGLRGVGSGSINERGSPPINASSTLQSNLHISGSRGSMILYRISASEDGALAMPPPGLSHLNRNSTYSVSGDSIVSLDGDSKYPVVGLMGTPKGGTPGTPGTPVLSAFGMRTPSVGDLNRPHGGLVAYAYDPDEDDDDDDEDDWLYDLEVDDIDMKLPNDGKLSASLSRPPSGMHSSNTSSSSGPTKGPSPNGKATAPVVPVRTRQRSNSISWRGFTNLSTLVVLITGLLCLFILLPITKAYSDNGVSTKILGNTRINATGQAVADSGNNARGLAMDKRWMELEFARDGDA
ncbi:hypothetical protein BDZ97DRAFT_1922071 [Flammula alnicola]|nr:hypothetical protein BDZ97DRAFT_1922071 [Flammula alnicola]